MYQIREFNINNVSYENINLIDQSLYEKNEQTINDIYLSTVAIENYEFSTDQVQALESIMVQCPFTGGSAVYTARAIYALIDPTVVWDDDNICILAGVYPRLASPVEPETEINVFPNPANNRLQVTYDVNEETEARFLLYNSFGILVLSERLDTQDNTTEILLENLSPGIYTCIVQINGESSYQSLISIVK